MSRRKEKKVKKSEEEQHTDEALCASAHKYFLLLSGSIFSQFWWENFFVGSGRKHMGPTIYFYFSSFNQTHTSKKFFIHSISLPNKHTLSDGFFTWKFDTLDPIR